MTGADRIEAERDAAIQHGGELDLLVAAQAGVRGTTGRVLCNEVVRSHRGEAIREIPYIERDPEYVGGPPSIVRIFLGAAATRTRPVALGFLDRARCTPVTSCPASTARAAATAESTPPDIAASTFIRVLLSWSVGNARAAPK